MKKEFDKYIDGYRCNCDRSLRLSGETSAYFAEYKARKLAEWLPSQVLLEGNILDFGCGDGTMTNCVKGLFPKAKIYGVDPSPKSIEEAQSQFKGIGFSVNSDEHTELDYPSDFFDLIFSAGVFHHIPFDKHASYVQELARVLKPGGHLVLFELNPLNPLTVLTFKRNPIDKHAKLMRPSYTKSLVNPYGKSETKFYCFYPKIFSWLRPTEPYLTHIPFGALYAVITEKSGLFR
jgi:SAM-dependent methyltransferase